MKQFIPKFFLLGGTYPLVLLTRLSLWLFPAQSVSFLSRYRQRSSPKTFQFPSPLGITYPVTLLVWAVERSASLPLGQMKCLGRALVTQTLLSVFGYSSQVCFGVAKENAHQIEAHAWVEYQGRIIIGQLPNINRFHPLSAGSIAEE